MAYTTVSEDSLRTIVFSNLREAIKANLPTGWNFYASYPVSESESNFPCIVLDSAKVTAITPAMRSDTRDFKVDVDVDVYSLASQGKKQNDEGRDYVTKQILDSASTLSGYKLYMNTDTPYDDSGITPFLTRPASPVSKHGQGKLVNSSTITFHFDYHD